MQIKPFNCVQNGIAKPVVQNGISKQVLQKIKLQGILKIMTNTLFFFFSRFPKRKFALLPNLCLVFHLAGPYLVHTASNSRKLKPPGVMSVQWLHG
jgi:hypothetical protein